MSILSIIGGGGGSPTPPPSNTPSPEASDPPPNTTEPSDTAPPAPATESQDSRTDTGTDTTPSDPQAESARVSLLADSADGSNTRAAVEAALALPPDQIEADARRFAEAAQQQQRLELLLEAVSEPVAPTVLSAPTAEQAQAGPVETEGTPV
ncbi:MAG: hypothetical protein AAGF36_04490 [Pseudomonadota bacterium]